MANNHGGARKGAGKPAQFEKPMKRKEVMLDEETIAFYLEYGEGNLSKGIRQYWRSLTKRVPDACPYCAGKGEFVNVIGKALRCNHCAGTGQRR